MSDAMSFAELAEHCVELLPARTALSLLRAGTGGSAGNGGEPGTRGANGQSIAGTAWGLFFPYYRSGSGYSLGDASSTNG